MRVRAEAAHIGLSFPIIVLVIYSYLSSGHYLTTPGPHLPQGEQLESLLPDPRLHRASVCSLSLSLQPTVKEGSLPSTVSPEAHHSLTRCNRASSGWGTTRPQSLSLGPSLGVVTPTTFGRPAAAWLLRLSSRGTSLPHSALWCSRDP
ncbi:hypothetical protein NDU88_001074 [Pleurodeles waltl]|uniref:Uncharacterized protein n=1 Tax=Pleurodeles waltl TaxID=8319 RepID=A0AAV7LYN4_PLEWA|nr:hypothetical protein NDU88_001074 [Pleurodeles waltl]